MTLYERVSLDTRYLARPMQLAVHLVNRGPRWVPRALRMVPLHVLVLLMRLHVVFRTL
jgi:hypothetical protein